MAGRHKGFSPNIIGDTARLSNISEESVRPVFDTRRLPIRIDWFPGEPFCFVHFRDPATAEASIEQIHFGLLKGYG
jgi:hypothetical protein